MGLLKINSIKSILTFVTLLLGMGCFAQANNSGEQRYRRHSICSILVRHDKDEFADEIETQFLNIPTDPMYNDHNLSVRVVNVSEKDVSNETVNKFVETNQIGSRLVAKWFNRNILTGACNLNLISQRGLYDASALDYDLASRSARGNAILEDAGEDLVGKTYLLMHEISYVNKSQKSQFWGTLGGIIVAAAYAYGGASASDVQKMMESTKAIISSYKGFAVKVKTRLYRLNWDPEVSGHFYHNLYTETADVGKRDMFERDRELFKMEYIGEVTSKGNRTSFLGISEETPQLMVRKACQRALEQNVADLQKKYEQFRLKAPIVTVAPTITATIGLKEGVTSNCKFEVLEAQEKDGKTTYKRVAIVKPVQNMIWDNRFMADKENAFGADFGATTFKKISGGEILPGHLLRQID